MFVLNDLTRRIKEKVKDMNKLVWSHEQRYDRTIAFIKRHFSEGTKILDLGVESDMARVMRANGFEVRNTQGEDLDCDYEGYLDTGVDLVTSFEIFEHMLAPYNILKDLKTKHLIVSVPLKLWFAKAYWNKEDHWDTHYHEFEPIQIEHLLRRTGWEIVDSEKWRSSNFKHLGIRPLLRFIYPRYYILYCRRPG